MTRILLIRHGQSKANEKNLFAGHWDIDMTELGMAQAEKTGEYIAQNYKVDKVYASDLMRAFKTGKATADKFGLEVEPSRKLREIDAGEWDEKVFDELPKLYPEQFGAWMNDMGKAHCPGGESVAELGERIMAELNRIADENDGKTVAIGTHATPIRVAMTFIMHGDIKMMTNVPWVSNASVTLIEKDNGKWSLIFSSYDEHLKDMATKLPGIV